MCFTQHKYGLTRDEYKRVLRCKSTRPCQICHKKDKLVIDHDHITGKYRGLLCRHCNLAIGHLQDDPERARAAAKYLQKHRNDTKSSDTVLESTTYSDQPVTQNL